MMQHVICIVLVNCETAPYHCRFSHIELILAQVENYVAEVLY